MIKNEFFPTRGFGKRRYLNVNKVISEYKKLTTNLELIAKLMFYYPEIEIMFTREYGYIDERFYINIETACENALEYVHKHNLQDMFRDQAHNIKVKAQNIGWGFKEDMAQNYYEYYYDDMD